MECRETERLIGAFIEDKLGMDDLDEFVRHTAACESCMEELSIQFLVGAGMKSLEEGNTFDLQKELQNRLDQAKRKVVRRKRIARFLYLLEMAAILLVLIMTIMVVIK